MTKYVFALVVIAACDVDATPSDSSDAAGLERRACTSLPTTATAKLQTEVVYESEELAFDGHGSLVAKKGEFLLRVPADGPTSYFSKDPALSTLSLGLRYLPDGDLAVTQPAVEDGLVARIIRVHPDGTVADYFTAADMPADLPPFIIPNTIAVDSAGGMYVGEFATSQVFHVAADKSVIPIVVGPDADRVAGAAWDEGRRYLYYTSDATVRRVSIGADGQPTSGATVFATIPNGRLDGIVLDACGNPYVIDSDPSTNHFALWRIVNNTQIQIATFDDIVSGAQFGAGHGWDDHSIYVSSVAGKIFRVKVGVGGL